jgi:hypothetical protein
MPTKALCGTDPVLTVTLSSAWPRRAGEEGVTMAKQIKSIEILAVANGEHRVARNFRPEAAKGRLYDGRHLYRAAQVRGAFVGRARRALGPAAHRQGVGPLDDQCTREIVFPASAGLSPLLRSARSWSKDGVSGKWHSRGPGSAWAIVRQRDFTTGIAIDISEPSRMRASNEPAKALLR